MRHRSPSYLEWIHRQRCARCNSDRGIEASHMGPGGTGKVGDIWCLPMCGKCHRAAPDSVHGLGGVRPWEKQHGVVAARLCMQYLEKYLTEGNSL